MNKEQIDEMANIIHDVAEAHHIIWCTELAKVLYNAGYRKESEVESLEKRIANQREEISKLQNYTRNLQQSRNHYKAKADRVGKQLFDVIQNQDKAKQEVASKIIREIRNAIFAHGTKYAMQELAKIENEHICKDINVPTNIGE